MCLPFYSNCHSSYFIEFCCSSRNNMNNVLDERRSPLGYTTNESLLKNSFCEIEC